ncbi:MAG: hypothetical protein PVG24_14440 [Gammaproteobacteria bacterium]|jgi:hypothetical protein
MQPLHTVFAYLPLLVMAVCVVLLFRRWGYARAHVMMSAIPLVVIVFSLLGALVGEPMLTGGTHGAWMLAAALIVLAFGRRPDGLGQSASGRNGRGEP